MKMKDFKENFQNLVNDCIGAHCRPVKPSKEVRKRDGKSPYSVHPIWRATMILHETGKAAALSRIHKPFDARGSNALRRAQYSQTRQNPHSGSFQMIRFFF